MTTQRHTIVGIDLGKYKVAAVASLPDGTWEHIAMELDREERELPRPKQLATLYYRVVGWLSYAIPRDQPLDVFIEEPPYVRNVQVMKSLSQVEGIVMMAAEVAGAMGIYEVNNTLWKRDVVGQGNAGKDDIRSYLVENHSDIADLVGDDQDRTDAACVCIYGSDVRARARELTS